MLVYTAPRTVYYSALISFLDLPSTDIRKSRLLETLLRQFIKKVRCGLSNSAAFTDLEWPSGSFALYRPFKCQFSRGYARADKILAVTERRAVPLSLCDRWASQSSSWEVSLLLMFIQQQQLRYTHHRRRSGVIVRGSTPSHEFGCGVFCSSDIHENFTKINVGLISARLTSGAASLAYITFLIARSPDRRPNPNGRVYNSFADPIAGGEGNNT